MGLFVDFHKKGTFEKSLNATSISLLPKVAGQGQGISTNSDL